ncbi:MAG: F0F1 ATP synthase subunit delta [Betaproteobacteria bacterium]
MAELTTVARPYAEAAFRASVEAKDVAGYGDKLQLFGAAASNAAAASLLGNPKVSAKEKAELLFSVAGGNVPDTLKNLANTLIENQRATLLPFISEHFARLQREHDGVVKALITSAFALSEADKATLIDGLAKKYGKRVEAEVKVDASLLGGARIQVGDDVIHASVRDTLDKMAIALAQ